MDKEVVRSIYTMEYHSAIKRNELESVLMDEPRACYTERSKSKRQKQVSCINTYRWIEKNGTSGPICKA